MLYSLNVNKCREPRDRIIPTVGRTHTYARSIIEPIRYQDFTIFDEYQADIEDAIAENILGDLLADQAVMPIIQPGLMAGRNDSLADIYALNRDGDLVIYELRRGAAGSLSANASLEYLENASRWGYTTLEWRYRSLFKLEAVSLAARHAEAFSLKEELAPGQFNRVQHLFVIGSAADKELSQAIGYWNASGVSVEFVPYRIYVLDERHYLEVFAPPGDRHFNPHLMKGVIFDPTWKAAESALWGMLSRATVETYGATKTLMRMFAPGDIVFYLHSEHGIVAAAKVKPGEVRRVDEDTLSRDVELLTAVSPEQEPVKAMPLEDARGLTGKTTGGGAVHVPCLSMKEADELLQELRRYLKE